MAQSLKKPQSPAPNMSVFCTAKSPGDIIHSFIHSLTNETDMKQLRPLRSHLSLLRLPFMFIFMRWSLQRRSYDVYWLARKFGFRDDSVVDWWLEVFMTHVFKWDEIILGSTFFLCYFREKCTCIIIHKTILKLSKSCLMRSSKFVHFLG